MTLARASQPNFLGKKVGDMVFVAQQKPFGSKNERKTETVPISKVGRKYLYIKHDKRDLPFDPHTGRSVHSEHNVRSNGYGFDVFHEESWYEAEQQHLRNVSQLKARLSFHTIANLTPSQAQSILEILAVEETDNEVPKF